MTRSGAVVGVAGGVGATRLTVEFGALLARDARDVALVDAAFATQGLARHVAGRIDPDVTAAAVGEADPAEARYRHPASASFPGTLAVYPAFAPFERLARAKAPDAARGLPEVADADHVLFDVPPVAANQSVAAVTEADRVALVYTPTERGVDALQRARGRLADLGTGADCTVANRADLDSAPPDADCAVPESGADAPAALDDGDALTPAAAAALERFLDVTLDADVGGGLLDGARRRLQ